MVAEVDFYLAGKSQMKSWPLLDFATWFSTRLCAGYLPYDCLNLIIGFMETLDPAWWAEITTITPHCIYYFGPFDSFDEAKSAYPGYIADLNSEGAQGITIVIKFCQPDELTMFEE